MMIDFDLAVRSVMSERGFSGSVDTFMGSDRLEYQEARVDLVRVLVKGGWSDEAVALRIGAAVRSVVTDAEISAFETPGVIVSDQVNQRKPNDRPKD